MRAFSTTSLLLVQTVMPNCKGNGMRLSIDNYQCHADSDILLHNTYADYVMPTSKLATIRQQALSKESQKG
jgi:hypothetical protein